MSKRPGVTKMQNKARPGVKIVLDRARTLKLDLNAMAAFEEATGKNLFGGAFENGAMSATELRAMLWACLLHEDETLTLRQVGAWITADNMLEIKGELDKAFEIAVPESEGDGAAPLVEAPPPG